MYSSSFILGALPPQTLGVSLAAAFVAAAAAFALGRAGRGKLKADSEELANRVRRAETTADESTRAMAKLRQEHGTVSRLAMNLPSVIRDMNRDDLETSEVPRLIQQLATSIFQPGKLLLYWVRARPGGDWKNRELRLVKHSGLDNVPDGLKSIPMGDGKLGWVAQHELDMLPEDWTKLQRTERVDVRDNDPSFRAEIIGPLVHHTKERQHVLGVLAIGDLGARPRDAKHMFQMVTNIASLALVSSHNMKKLRSMANHDGLTELLNKSSFLTDFGPKSLLSCERDAKRFSLFLFDIDHFKNYNDTNGHPAGDELLKGMARLIKANLRPGDMASRYGGEEFVIGMPDTDPATALEQAEKIRQAVAATAFAHSERQPLGHISVSGGVATFPQDGSSVAELLQHADEALYQCKEAGRNNVRAWRGVEIGGNYDVKVDTALIDSQGHLR